MFPNDENLEGEFTLESEKGGIVEDEFYNVLILGDFSGDGVKRDLSTRKPVEIDRDNFDDIMRRIAPRVAIGSVDNPIEIAFGTIDDFHPDELYRNLPIFEELRELRRELKSADGFNRAAGRVRSWFAAEAPKPAVAQSDAPSSGNLLDDILGGGASSAPRRSASPLDDFVSRIVAPHVVNVDEDEQQRLVAAVDGVIAETMRSILHLPRFRELEAAWRGLFFLVRRYETDAAHKLFVQDLSKAELVDNLKSVNQLAESSFARAATLVDNLGLVAGCFDFSLVVDDVAALLRVSQVGQALGVPFVSHVSHPAVTGEELSETEAKLWTALRSAPSSPYVGLVPMRVLARVPYGAASEPLDAFSFEEFDGEPDDAELCRFNPSIAVALLLASGERDGRVYTELSRLPLYTYDSGDGKTSIPCAEFVINERTLQRLLDEGLMPIAGFRDQDRAVIPRFQSVSLKTPSLGAKR